MPHGDVPGTVVSYKPRVVVHTAPNPGPKTLTGTHTYVVGQERALVIDPGPVAPDYQQGIASALRSAETRPVAILLSHGHPDHAPGARVLKDLLGVEVIASRFIDPASAAAAGVNRYFDTEETFDLGSDRLCVLATPGHAPDQVAFWIPTARILFTGDTILGSGSTLIAPPEGDMISYMRTLEEMRTLYPRVILPGHGPIVSDPNTKIDDYVAHRRRRERQLLETLAEGPGTIAQLVSRMYVDTDPRLHDLASGSVAAQLQKLEREGMVLNAGDTYTLRSG